jgi:acyl-CoA synthetase (AMP-forming)/AMP-acid ligase II
MTRAAHHISDQNGCSEKLVDRRAVVRHASDHERHGEDGMRGGRSDHPRSARTFPELIRSAAAAYGDDIAITLKGDDIWKEAMSFAELDRQSAEIARGLLARGVGKGTRIAFIYGNSPTFALLFAAIGRIGAIAIPLSTLLKSGELVRTLRQSDAAGLIVQRTMLGYDYVERLCDALPGLACGDNPDLRLDETPYLRWIISSGDALPPTFRDMAFLTGVADTVSETLLRAAEAEVHATDQLVEIYTSGSMALPKGVRHNHGPVLFRAHYLRETGGIMRGQQVNAFLPMFWVGGMMMYLMPNWEAGAVTDCGEKTLLSSQIAMGSVLADEDLKLIASVRPFWGLGMSETLGPYSYGDELRAPGYPLCAPMDHFADRYDVRVADEDGNPVVSGEVGEIQIRGYALTPGLHKIERQDYFTPDGYYHTGDMGLFQGSRLLFVGRNGDVIKTANSNVSPAEIELEMQQLDGVHSAYVVGIPDKDRGQLVVAAVVPRDGAALDFAAIEAALRRRMSSYKVPRAYVAISRDEVPLLPSNKVARRQVEAMMIERLGRAAGESGVTKRVQT